MPVVFTSPTVLTESVHLQQPKCICFSNGANNFIRRSSDDGNKSSAFKQIAFGVGAGWIAGLLALRFGTAVALTLGGGIITFKTANEMGYISVNWNKVNNDFGRIAVIANNAGEQMSNQTPSCINKVVTFVKQTTPYSTAFFGGFLVGLLCVKQATKNV